jgi:hypothetical protein
MKGREFTVAGIGKIFARTVRSLGLPIHLARKAEALHLADRTSEALEVMMEAEAIAERFEQRWYCAELHRLRGVFLAAIAGDEAQLKIPSTQRSGSHENISRFPKRNARKQPARNTVAKKRTRQEDVIGSDSLFGKWNQKS